MPQERRRLRILEFGEHTAAGRDTEFIAVDHNGMIVTPSRRYDSSRRR